MSCPLIAVIDLKNARAVHAVAGRRAHYRPIQSSLNPGDDPVALGRAMRDTLGIDSLYVADIDAIQGNPPSPRTYAELLSLGTTVWLDAGVHDVASLGVFQELDRARLKVVVGLETVRGPADLTAILDVAGSDDVIFSLDLFDACPLMAVPRAWKADDPFALASLAIELGVRQLLVLDLARVGTRSGPGTERLIGQIVSAHPNVSVSAGGGVASIEDVSMLRRAGAAHILVGSALHDGRIGRSEIEWLTAAGNKVP